MKRGRIKGEKVGHREGRKEGREESSRETAKKLLEKGKLTIEEIAECCGLTEEEVETLK